MEQETAEKATSSDNGPGTHVPARMVKLKYFTDPLCCWSWAMQPQLDQLLRAYGTQLHIEYLMGGMLENWETYNDSLNTVYTPTQMGPLWAYTAETTGVHIDASVWVNDPPASSYPACIAVKCMELQSREAGAYYLHRLREAVMTGQQNIGRKKTLLQVAQEMAGGPNGEFDFARFKNDLEQQRGVEGFLSDMVEKKRYGITRFPALVMQHGLTTLYLMGYRHYNDLEQAFNYINAQTTMQNKRS